MTLQPIDKLFRIIFSRLSPQSKSLLDHLITAEHHRKERSERVANRGRLDYDNVLQWRRPRPKYRLAAESVARLRQRIAAFESERGSAKTLLDELLSLPVTERHEAIVKEERFQSLALCETLLGASRQESFRDPKEGQKLAELGLQVARALDPDRYGTHVVRDLCGRAWTDLGNAYRMNFDLEGAERAFLKAGACLADSYDPLEKAHFLNEQAALRKDQRRFQEGLALRDQAISIYRRFKDHHLLGFSLCGKGSDLLEMGEPELATRALLESVDLIDPTADPKLSLAAHHNLATALVLQERYLEAAEAFSKFERLYREDLWYQARRQWLRGRITAGLGRFKDAEEAFRTAREDFKTHDIPYDFALVSIELALVYARQGRSAEVKQLAAEMVPIFKSRQIHREALAALTLFRQAVEQETLTVGTLRKIIDRLEKAPKKA